jgi:hypothetical protein
MVRQNNQSWIIESPLVMVAGEVIAYSIDWLGANKVISPVVTVYKQNKDITATVLVSGDEHVVSGNVVTLKKITARAGDGGSQYVVSISCDVDRNIEIRKLLIQVVKPGSES